MSREELKREFPSLSSSPFEITSPKTKSYNCVAWAANDPTRWWWPVGALMPGYFWPLGVPRKVDIDSFVAAFQTMGFEVCPDGDPEKDFEKVAIFCDTDNRPTHAARQLPDGRWTSKMGKGEDIVHERLDQVSGRLYGAARTFMKRAVKAKGQQPSVSPA